MELRGAIGWYLNARHERTQYSSQLVVETRIGPVLAYGVDKEGLVQNDRKCQTGAYDLPSTFVDAAVDFNLVGLHVIKEYKHGQSTMSVPAIKEFMPVRKWQSSLLL